MHPMGRLFFFACYLPEFGLFTGCILTVIQFLQEGPNVSSDLTSLYSLI